MPAKSSLQHVVEAIELQLKDKHIHFAVGESERSAHGSDKRVIWVPAGGRLGPPNRMEFVLADGSKLTPIHTNELRVLAHMQAEDLASLEQLWTDVLTAVRRVLGPSSTATDYTISSEADRAGVSSRGGHATLTQTFEWRLIISSMAKTRIGPTLHSSPRVIITAHELTFDITEDT